MIVYLRKYNYKTKNTATFNSGHDKSPEFDYPYSWDYISIHDIY